MRIKIVILKLFLSLILLSGNAIAKNLPPGSGISDVPANVLILLDKSGSMGARMTSGAGIYYPYSVAVDTNGDVYAGQYYTYGIKKFTYGSKAVDTSFAQNGTYKGSGNCLSYYPYDMEVHNGYLYVATYYRHRVFRINLSTGKCDWNSKRIYYARNVTISSNNILYAFGSWGNNVVRNVSTNTDISCSTPQWARYTSGTTVDASSSNFYVHYW